jgi:hypothetical protein
MKFKSILALALTLATIGLSLPAVAAGDRDGGENSSSETSNKRPKYYGKYHYYKLGNSHIYIGSRGDYFDRDGKYHRADEHPEYRQYYSQDYKYDRYGNYYDESGKFHNAKQDDGDRNSDRKYYGKYHYYKLGNSHIYIGSRGDYFDSDRQYHGADEHPEYRQYYSQDYNYDRSGDYFDSSGKYHNSKQDRRDRRN